MARTQKNLGDIFEASLEKIRNAGCPASVIDCFAFQKARVIEEAGKMEFADKELPFLPVIPLGFLGLCPAEQMQMIKIAGKKGAVRISETVRDNGGNSANKFPYFCFGVAVKLSETIKLLDVQRAIIKAERKLSCLAEIIAVCMLYPDILEKSSVVALGSRCATLAPEISAKDGAPTLEYILPEYAYDHCRVVSCANRACYF